jgi:hypothetical protein
MRKRKVEKPYLHMFLVVEQYQPERIFISKRDYIIAPENDKMSLKKKRFAEKSSNLSRAAGTVHNNTCSGHSCS